MRWRVVGGLVMSACGRVAFDPQPPADAAPLGQPSCIGLPTTCGPSHDQSCCASAVVPGGMFYRGYDLGADGAYADKTNPATVGDVRLDTYEVTVGRFRAFVDAGMGTQASPPAAGAGAHPAIAGSGWNPAWNASLTANLATAVSCGNGLQTWTTTPGANEELPIMCVTWFEAMAFCAWDGGFLPTEAEWNHAAAGGDEQRAYPWSSPPNALAVDCTYANYAPAGVGCSGGIGTVLRVGSDSPKGDGRWGHADLGGNAWEWVLDTWGTYANPCTDCARLGGGNQRTMCGGDDHDIEASMRTGNRFMEPATFRGTPGIRCARAP